MSLNTNGWDFGYHVKLSDINSFISSQSTSNLKLINEINGNQDVISGILPKPVNTSKGAFTVDQFIIAVFKELIVHIPMYKDYSDKIPCWREFATRAINFFGKNFDNIYIRNNYKRE